LTNESHDFVFLKRQKSLNKFFGLRNFRSTGQVSIQRYGLFMEVENFVANSVKPQRGIGRLAGAVGANGLML
jgi:hypothetical protein